MSEIITVVDPAPNGARVVPDQQQVDYLRSQLAAARESRDLNQDIIARMRNDWKIVSKRLHDEAAERGWCGEYDDIVEDVNNDMKEHQLIVRVKDFDVSTTVTLTYNFQIGVQAKTEDEAVEIVNNMDFDDIFSKLRNNHTMDEYDDWNTNVGSAEES